MIECIHRSREKFCSRMFPSDRMQWKSQARKIIPSTRECIHSTLSDIHCCRFFVDGEWIDEV